MLLMEGTASIFNPDSQRLLAKISTDTKSLQPIFILCDRCYWCATYLGNTRIQADNNCPQCNANSNELTSFPIMPNESFAFSYNRNVE